jgi:hypothetical protein
MLDDRRARRKAQRVEDRDVIEHIQIGPGASRDSIRKELVEALEERHLTWSQQKIDLAVDTFGATTGNRWLAAPRAMRALRRGLRRDV